MFTVRRHHRRSKLPDERLVPSRRGGSSLVDVIAATVLGGTSLFGGFATIIGTVAGALFINFVQINKGDQQCDQMRRIKKSKTFAQKRKAQAFFKSPKP